MFPILLRTASITALLLLTSCGLAPIIYNGDGRLSDAGPFADNNRYVLDLGPIDLSRAGTYRFEIARLPDENFVLGFDITPTARGAQSIVGRGPVETQVGLEVTNERDELVISVARPLSSWTWSGIGRPEFPDIAFVYFRGKLDFVPRGAGVTEAVSDGQGPDSGWGTYFRPRPDGRYLVRLAIKPSDSSAENVVARFQAKGGGWK